MITARPLQPEDVQSILTHYPRAGTLMHVTTTSGRFFLRRRNPRYAVEEAVVFDHHLMEHLATRGLPVVLACAVQEDEPTVPEVRRWVRRGPDDVVELYPWWDGHPFDRQSAAHLRAAGRALGQFHAATRTFTGPPGKDWPRYDPPETSLAGLRQAGDLEGAGGQRARLGFLEQEAAALAAALPDAHYAALPHAVLHGDYHPANVLFAVDCVAGIFDLDWATCQPRVRDLADGILFFAARRTTDIEDNDIDSLTQTPVLDETRTDIFLKPTRVGHTGRWRRRRLLPSLNSCARWLFCRVDGMRKVPAGRRLTFLLDGVVPPPDWLARHPHPFITGSAVHV